MGDNSTSSKFIIMYVALICFSIATGYLWDTLNTMKHQAIERGYALFCPTTGDFAWKGECDE